MIFPFFHFRIESVGAAFVFPRYVSDDRALLLDEFIPADPRRHLIRPVDFFGCREFCEPRRVPSIVKTELSDDLPDELPLASPRCLDRLDLGFDLFWSVLDLAVEVVDLCTS